MSCGGFRCKSRKACSPWKRVLRRQRPTLSRPRELQRRPARLHLSQPPRRKARMIFPPTLNPPRHHPRRAAPCARNPARVRNRTCRVSMSLEKHRKAIDRLDGEIVALLNKRTKHVLEIGALKVKAGEEIYAPHRELAVLEKISAINQGPITNESLKSIYREVMSSALSLEKTMTIAYFGPEATFTHQAAIRKFGSSLNYSPHKTIADVFTEVSKRRADYGVVPIENSTEGVVTHTLDMFVDSDLKIVAQIILRVQHCLLSRSPRSKIKKLFAHPQALAQCRAWVQNHLPRAEIIETSSDRKSTR